MDNISASTASHSKSPENPEGAILDLILNGTLGLDAVQFKYPYRNGKVKKKKVHYNNVKVRKLVKRYSQKYLMGLRCFMDTASEGERKNVF